MTLPEMTGSTLADRIQFLADQYGGQAALGRVIYTNYQQVWRWCSGLTAPNYTMLAVICRETGCDANWLLGVNQ